MVARRLLFERLNSHTQRSDEADLIARNLQHVIDDYTWEVPGQDRSPASLRGMTSREEVLDDFVTRLKQKILAWEPRLEYVDIELKEDRASPGVKNIRVAGKILVPEIREEFDFAVDIGGNYA